MTFNGSNQVRTQCIQTLSTGLLAPPLKVIIDYYFLYKLHSHRCSPHALPFNKFALIECLWSMQEYKESERQGERAIFIWRKSRTPTNCLHQKGTLEVVLDSIRLSAAAGETRGAFNMRARAVNDTAPDARRDSHLDICKWNKKKYITQRTSVCIGAPIGGKWCYRNEMPTRAGVWLQLMSCVLYSYKKRIGAWCTHAPATQYTVNEIN